MKIQVSRFLLAKQKNFIGYKNDVYKVKPLCIMLPKRSTYVKICDDEIKCMYFCIEDDELLENYNNIWNKVSNSIQKEFDCEPIHNKKFLKTKLLSYGDEATEFNNKEIPKLGCNNSNIN